MHPTLFARAGLRAALPSLALAGLVALGAPSVSAATFTAATPAELIAAINTANATPEADTIELTAGATYTFTAVDNWWYGPNALPPIASPIIIEGHGATLAIGGDPVRLRFFFIGANPASPRTLAYHSPGAGNLTLRYLTLTGGIAKGGNSNQGGGGAGMGGAIFNQGSLALDSVTIRGNTAAGGSSMIGDISDYGGGGMGANASGDTGGGFGGSVSPTGAAAFGNGGGFGEGGTSPGTSTARGGAGFGRNDRPSWKDGGGTRDGLGGWSAILNGKGGRGSGGGALVTGSTGCGGGGIGGGGGGNSTRDSGAGGGFGGGGGGSPDCGGHGGFGGGSGAGTSFGGGFGGGFGSNTSNCGGGGAGMGGAIFNHGGTLTCTNSTLAGNTAQGGAGFTGGSGYGGVLFNLNGRAILTACTLANNNVIAGAGTFSVGSAAGGALYNLRYTLDATCPNAGVTLSSCLLADTNGGSDLVNNRPNQLTGGGDYGTNTGDALVIFEGANLVEIYGNQGYATSSGPIPLTTDPLLGSLGDYGGGTWTFPLLPGSPAINAGIASATDQRSMPRVGAPDLGAFESQGFWFTKTSGDNQSAAPGTAFADSLALTVTAYALVEPVNGGIVTFTAPGSGASATLSANRTTITGGAVVVTATANATAGKYTIPASANGATSVRFALANGVFNYTVWAAAHFTADELGNPVVSGADADPDGAGVTNLLRYAFDLPARGPVSAPTTVGYNGTGNPATLTLSFTLRADGTDLVYAVMASEDLVTWTQKAAYTPYGPKETVYCTVDAPAGAKRYFLRLDIVTK